MGQKDQGHMMVPAAPEAQFVVVHAQFSLAFSKTSLNGPAHAAHAHKGGKRRLQGRITQVKLPFWLFCRATHFAPDHHPDFWARQAIQRQEGAQQEKISDEWAFVPLQQAKALPMRG